VPFEGGAVVDQALLPLPAIAGVGQVFQQAPAFLLLAEL